MEPLDLAASGSVFNTGNAIRLATHDNPCERGIGENAEVASFQRAGNGRIG